MRLNLKNICVFFFAICFLPSCRTDNTKWDDKEYVTELAKRCYLERCAYGKGEHTQKEFPNYDQILKCSESLKLRQVRFVPGRNSDQKDFLYRCFVDDMVHDVLVSVLEDPPRCFEREYGYYGSVLIRPIGAANNKNFHDGLNDHSVCSFDGSWLTEEQLSQVVIVEY